MKRGTAFSERPESELRPWGGGGEAEFLLVGALHQLCGPVFLVDTFYSESRPLGVARMPLGAREQGLVMGSESRMQGPHLRAAAARERSAAEP